MQRRPTLSHSTTLLLCSLLLLSCKISSELWIEASGQGHGRIVITAKPPEGVTSTDQESSDWRLDPALKELVENTFNSWGTEDSSEPSPSVNPTIPNPPQTPREKALEACQSLEEEGESNPFTGLKVTNAEQTEPSDEFRLLCQFTWLAIQRDVTEHGAYHIDFSNFLTKTDPKEEVEHTLTVHVDGVIDAKASTGALSGKETIIFDPEITHRILVYRDLFVTEQIVRGLRDPIWSGIAALLAFFMAILSIRQWRSQKTSDD